MSNKPTPHPHAELICKWANEGVQIQKYMSTVEDWRDDANPQWLPQCKYRIKPEESNEPWKPEEGDVFFAVDYCGDVVDLEFQSEWKDNYKLAEIGNCFRTREEAEAAVERVKAALKGDFASDTNVSRKPEIDGKPISEEETEMIRLHREHLENANQGWHKQWDFLTEGEHALIKALRNYPLSQIHGLDEKSLLIHIDDEGHFNANISHIAVLTKGDGESEGLREALKQIQAEQEAQNEAE